MASARQYIDTAASYIGVGGTDNIFNTWIWGQHVYDPNVYPWCAAFQSYVGVHDLGMPFNPSASAAGVAWQGERVDDSEVQPGDWVLFNWDGRQDFGWADHIGLVEWFDHGSGYFGTIEGNTGGGEGSVMRCTRYNYSSYATAFFRPPYGDDDMKTGWIHDDSGWWYRRADGSWPAGCWEEIDSKWYLFGDDGYMLVGWQEWEGDWYYLQPKTSKTGDRFGYMLTGWQSIKWNGKARKFYFREKSPVGTMLKSCFYKIGGKWYAFDKNGVMSTDSAALTVDASTGVVKINAAK